MLVDPVDSDNSDPDESEDVRFARERKNKANLLQWVTDADFSREFNLLDLVNHPFQLDTDE